MPIARSLTCTLAAMLWAATALPAAAQHPTDKRPPGMNRPVGVGKPNPPPRPRPPGPARPPARPGPARPGFRPPFNAHLPRHRYRLGAYQRPGGYYFRQWTTGLVLPSLFRSQNYWLTSPGAYGLRPPPPGTQWVRVDYDALLVDNATGQVVDIVYNIFY